MNSNGSDDDDYDDDDDDTTSMVGLKFHWRDVDDDSNRRKRIIRDSVRPVCTDRLLEDLRRPASTHGPINARGSPLVYELTKPTLPRSNAPTESEHMTDTTAQ